MRPRNPSRLLVLVLCGLVLAACAQPGVGDPVRTSTADDFGGRVSTTPGGLRLDGAPWWPAGLDAYQLGTDWSVNKGCGAEVDLDDYFARLPERSLTRFNLFAAFAVDKNTAMINFAPLDAVFAAAERHDQMVLPVLTSNEGACEDDVFKPRSWYQDGWRTTTSSGKLTYQQWVGMAIERWHDEHALAGWEPIGEPETSDCPAGTGAGGCEWQQRTCHSGAGQVLRRFFDDVGAKIRSLDDRHPIFSGLVGGDQCGTEGADYATVAASAGVDVLDFHDYDERSTMPGQGDQSLEARLETARRLGKPLMVNEIGIHAGSCLDLTERASRFRAKIEAQRDAGTAGALLWAFVPDPRKSSCSFDIGPDDPAWSVIRQNSR
ncbi:beta-mannosidase [Gordonia insulae]|nr:beta-mannosidase [Gordonia insulae]